MHGKISTFFALILLASLLALFTPTLATQPGSSTWQWRNGVRLQRIKDEIQEWKDFIDEACKESKKCEGDSSDPDPIVEFYGSEAPEKLRKVEMSKKKRLDPDDGDEPCAGELCDPRSYKCTNMPGYKHKRGMFKTCCTKSQKASHRGGCGE